MEKKFEYWLTFYKRLIERAWMLDACSALGRHPVLEAKLENDEVKLTGIDPHVDGDLVVYKVDGAPKVGYTIGGNKAVYITELAEVTDKPLFNAIDEFTMPAGTMQNKEAVKTTIGRFIFNYILWGRHEGLVHEYINAEIAAKDVKNYIAGGIFNKTLEVADATKIINSLFYLGSFSALFVPTLTEKSMTTSSAIMKRKKELIEFYGDKLTDPLVAKKYEQELIELDKENLAGDKSMRFLKPLPAKTFNVQRKKMFIGLGCVPSFSKSSNTYTFIPESLSEGWSAESLPSICNEIRKGAYDRGKETAKGGEQTKFLLRVFQDVRVIEDDCGSTKGMAITLDEAIAPECVGCYMITSKGLELLTDDNVKKYIGKEIVLRSPMFCKTKGGRCAKCTGIRFTKVNMQAVGLSVLRVGSRILTMFMKNMHGTSISTVKVDPFNYLQ